MASVTVRDVRLSDHDEWVELYAGYRDFYRYAPDPAAVDTTWGWVSTGEHTMHGLVAVDSTGKIVALANLRDVPRPSVGRLGIYLDDLYTDPAARGLGAGSALLVRAAELAAERDAVVVRWVTASDNETARRLYDRHAKLTPFVTYDMPPAAG